MAITWTYSFQVSGSTHADLHEAVLTEWRKYKGDPDAELPWNTEIKVRSGDATAEYEADVSISWA